jgi:hypothetical protein
VQVGAANRAGGDFDDRVGGILNRRLGNIIETNIADTAKYNRFDVCLRAFELAVFRSDAGSIGQWTRESPRLFI